LAGGFRLLPVGFYLGSLAAFGYLLQVPEPSIIGWTEHVDLPDWDVCGLEAKVDTGARTSALHVENLIHHHDGWVTFDVRLHRRKHDRRQHVRARLVKVGRVRSSSGQYAERCFVRTRIRVGVVEKEIELSLVSREAMLFRMLLGRKALEHEFWVDVSRRNLLTRRPRKKKRAKKHPATVHS